MTSVDTEILNVDDLAKLFACDKETAAARLTSGDLPGVKVGRGWIIPRQALLERLNDKAREEAATRRAHLAMAQCGHQLHNQEEQTHLPSLKNSAPSVLLPAAGSNRRGRNRRDPPPLPSLLK